MKVNLHRAFIKAQGEEAYSFVMNGEVKEKHYQLIDDVICQGLFDGKNLKPTGNDDEDSRIKLKAFELYQKLRKADGEVEITTEEATMIKKVALPLPPGAYGQVYNLIEGEK